MQTRGHTQQEHSVGNIMLRSSTHKTRTKLRGTAWQVAVQQVTTTTKNLAKDTGSCGGGTCGDCVTRHCVPFGRVRRRSGPLDAPPLSPPAIHHALSGHTFIYLLRCARWTHGSTGTADTSDDASICDPDDGYCLRHARFDSDSTVTVIGRSAQSGKSGGSATRIESGRRQRPMGPRRAQRHTHAHIHTLATS